MAEADDAVLRAPGALLDNHPRRKRYFSRAAGTRSFAKAPVMTVLRGLSYVAVTRTGIPNTFTVPFGNTRFKMRVQHPKPLFGIAGIYLQRRYYESLLEFGHKLISPGDCAIDGGASQGVYSCAFAAKVGVNGIIYAFEPLDYAITCLRNNIALNGFANVTLFEGAIAEKSGRAFIDLTEGPVSASIARNYGRRSGVEVTTFGLDDLRRQGKIGRVQFLKLDVEGAELSALKGAREILSEDKPRLCLEVLEQGLFEEIVEFLAPLGLRPYIFDDHGALERFGRFVPAANVYFLN
jgi:FkbM family methyltransferase